LQVPFEVEPADVVPVLQHGCPLAPHATQLPVEEESEHAVFGAVHM
jgi:hypothetical protein